MDLKFDLERASLYTSAQQRIRVLSEHWVRSHVYCPSCGQDRIQQYMNNKPVGDFHCLYCKEQYELKSQKTSFGFKVVDSAYKTMIERLSGADVPNLFLLNYNRSSFSVSNLTLIPKQFLVPEIVERRKPLSQSARRAGWTGCNILIGSIPAAGRIVLIKNTSVRSKINVLAEWRHMLFLRDKIPLSGRTWLLDVMKCIEELNRLDFCLSDIYSFESRFSAKYPNNKHIREKIRQQLQILRDNGYLRFKSRGSYELTDGR